MRRYFKICLIVILCLLTTACGKGGYQELSYQKLLDKMENKDSFILTLSAASCSNCEIFKDTITELTDKYNITVYYIDLDELSSEEESNLKSIFFYTGTPTTVNIVDGVENNTLSRIVGAKDYMSVKDKLMSWGYIKE